MKRTAALGVSAGLGLAAAVTFTAFGAAATVERKGTWPEDEAAISVDVSAATRVDALREVAEQAGWSLIAKDVGAGTVDLQIRGQSPAKVLDLLLADGDYVATRDGTLVSITRRGAAAVAEGGGLAAPPAPPAPPEPPAPPLPEDKGQDRLITGGSLVVEAKDVVHDVAIIGGEAEVAGLVTGDLSVIGGRLDVLEGGRIAGDVSILGGEVNVAKGGRIDGEIEITGGALHREEGAVVGGRVTQTGQEDEPEEASTNDDEDEGFLAAVGESMSQSAMFFVLGSVLLSVATERVRRVAAEVAARPARCFGLGILWVLLSCVLVVALAVTIIGIPIALLGVLVFVLGLLGGGAAALLTLGHAALRHRTDNPYAHLAAGAAFLFFARLIPGIGELLANSAILLGFGAFVATRAAGYWPERRKPAGPSAT